jgi:hypothetical protein
MQLGTAEDGESERVDSPHAAKAKKPRQINDLSGFLNLGRRDWIRTNDPHHVKGHIAVISMCNANYKLVKSKFNIHHQFR